MQHKNYFLLIAFFCFSALYGQTSAERKAIESLCGCFEVSFEYAETFIRDTSYHQLAKPYRAGALEYVVAEEKTPGKMVLQHLLVINDSTIIKHWRQDWEYQPSSLFAYEGNRNWSVSRVPSRETRGQWAQKVYEVDDSPRYSGAATWFLRDGRQVWENTADAPLPRREYTKRSDYQVMRRKNRNIVTEQGWVHEQDNEKVVLDASGEHTLVEEKGLNIYHRTDNTRCANAATWWQQHRTFWNQVRAVWDEILASNNHISVLRQVEGRYLGQELDGLSGNTYPSDAEARKAIRAVLKKYLQTVTTRSNK